MRLAPSLASALLVLAAPTTAKADPAAIATFAAWTATCDNLRECVIIGSNDEGDGLFYVRVARGAGAAAAAEAKVVLAASDPIAGRPETIALQVEGGRSVARFSVPVTKDDPDGAVLSGAVPELSFIDALAGGGTLAYAAGALKGTLSLQGAAAAMRFVDEHQGRLGTTAALVARGSASADRTPPPPPTPVVQQATGSAVPVSAPVLGRALLDLAKPACDPETVEAHADAAAWTLQGGRVLVAVPCAEGAYNVSAALFTTDAKGEQPRPVMLEQPVGLGDAGADNVVTNSVFDAKTLTLSDLDKARGLGDCGEARTWIWTGELFALLTATKIEACPGALPEDWPVLFRASRKER